MKCRRTHIVVRTQREYNLRVYIPTAQPVFDKIIYGPVRSCQCMNSGDEHTSVDEPIFKFRIPRQQLLLQERSILHISIQRNVESVVCW